MKCPLCPKLGGAKCQTTLTMKDSIFEQSIPNYHNNAINNKIERQSINYIPLLDEVEGYNFIILQYSLDNIIEDPLKSEKIWANVSCMFLLDFDLLKIDKKKLNYLFSISCISFHPELEDLKFIQNIMKSIVSTIKFLKQNEVLKINIIYRQKKFNIFSNNTKNQNNNQFINKKTIVQNSKKLKSKIKKKIQKLKLRKKMNNYFNKLLILWKKMRNLLLLYKIIKLLKFSILTKEYLYYDLEEKDRIWKQLANEKYSSEQIYVLYQRAIGMRKKQKSSNNISQLEMPILQELHNRRRYSIYSEAMIFKRQKKQKDKQELNKISLKIRIPKDAIKLQQCFCKQDINNEDMIQCEIFSEWYHLKCLGFIRNIKETQKLLFYCFKCECNLNKEQNKYIQRYNQYFVDSTFKDLKLKIGVLPHELRTHEKKNYKQLSK